MRGACPRPAGQGPRVRRVAGILARLLAPLLATAVALASLAGVAAAQGVRSEQAPPPVAAGGADGVSWLRQMVAAEGRYAFASPPEERSELAGAADRAGGGGFAWPAGATIEAVLERFDVRVVGRERSGDRAVVVVEAIPRHDAPQWRFWVDAATGSRLAYRAVLADGRVVAEGRGDPSALARPAVANPLPAPRPPAADTAARWTRVFGGLAGFDPVEVARVRLAGDVPAIRVTLWDGLSGVVLLVYPAGGTPSRTEWVVSRRSGRLVLSVVGPLPADTATRYLESLASRPWAQGDLDALLRVLTAP